MDESQSALIVIVVVVIVSLVVLGVLVALGYLTLVRLRERRSNRRSLPSGMTSDPTRFARFDEEGDDQNR